MGSDVEVETRTSGSFIRPTITVPTFLDLENEEGESRYGDDFPAVEISSDRMLEEDRLSVSTHSLDEEYFERLAHIGSGAYSDVFLCRDRRTDSLVAVKVVKFVSVSSAASRSAASGRDSVELIDPIEIEKKVLRTIMSQAPHPNIVECYGWFPAEQWMCFVFQYCDCGSLQNILKLIRKKRRRSKRQRREISREDDNLPLVENSTSGEKPEPLVPEYVLACIASQLLRGLHELHARKMIHRDVNPSNILLTSDGEVKLSDFNSVQLSDSVYLDDSRSFVGTTLYMSPERLEMLQCSFEADIWALGVTLFECATGRNPFLLRDRPDGFDSSRPTPSGSMHNFLCQENADTSPVEFGSALNPDLAEFSFEHPILESRISNIGDLPECDEDVGDVGGGTASGTDTASLVRRAGPMDISLASRILFEEPPRLSSEVFSSECIDFVQCCLRKDPASRPLTAPLSHHPFLTQYFANRPEECMYSYLQSWLLEHHIPEIICARWMGRVDLDGLRRVLPDDILEHVEEFHDLSVGVHVNNETLTQEIPRHDHSERTVVSDGDIVRDDKESLTSKPPVISSEGKEIPPLGVLRSHARSIFSGESSGCHVASSAPAVLRPRSLGFPSGFHFRHSVPDAESNECTQDSSSSLSGSTSSRGPSGHLSIPDFISLEWLIGPGILWSICCEQFKCGMSDTPVSSISSMSTSSTIAPALDMSDGPDTPIVMMDLSPGWISADDGANSLEWRTDSRSCCPPLGTTESVSVDSKLDRRSDCFHTRSHGLRIAVTAAEVAELERDRDSVVQNTVDADPSTNMDDDKLKDIHSELDTCLSVSSTSSPSSATVSWSSGAKQFSANSEHVFSVDDTVIRSNAPSSDMVQIKESVVEIGNLPVDSLLISQTIHQSSVSNPAPSPCRRYRRTRRDRDREMVEIRRTPKEQNDDHTTNSSCTSNSVPIVRCNIVDWSMASSAPAATVCEYSSTPAYPAHGYPTDFENTVRVDENSLQNLDRDCRDDKTSCEYRSAEVANSGIDHSKRIRDVSQCEFHELAERIRARVHGHGIPIRSPAEATRLKLRLRMPDSHMSSTYGNDDSVCQFRSELQKSEKICFTDEILSSSRPEQISILRLNSDESLAFDNPSRSSRPPRHLPRHRRLTVTDLLPRNINLGALPDSGLLDPLTTVYPVSMIQMNSFRGRLTSLPNSLNLTVASVSSSSRHAPSISSENRDVSYSDNHARWRDRTALWNETDDDHCGNSSSTLRSWNSFTQFRDLFPGHHSNGREVTDDPNPPILVSVVEDRSRYHTFSGPEHTSRNPNLKSNSGRSERYSSDSHTLSLEKSIQLSRNSPDLQKRRSSVLTVHVPPPHLLSMKNSISRAPRVDAKEYSSAQTSSFVSDSTSDQTCDFVAFEEGNFPSDRDSNDDRLAPLEGLNFSKSRRFFSFRGGSGSGESGIVRWNSLSGSSSLGSSFSRSKSRSIGLDSSFSSSKQLRDIWIPLRDLSPDERCRLQLIEEEARASFVRRRVQREVEELCRSDLAIAGPSIQIATSESPSSPAVLSVPQLNQQNASFVYSSSSSSSRSAPSFSSSKSSSGSSENLKSSDVGKSSPSRISFVEKNLALSFRQLPSLSDPDIIPSLPRSRSSLSASGAEKSISSRSSRRVSPHPNPSAVSYLALLTKRFQRLQGKHSFDGLSTSEESDSFGHSSLDETVNRSDSSSLSLIEECVPTAAHPSLRGSADSSRPHTPSHMFRRSNQISPSLTSSPIHMFSLFSHSTLPSLPSVPNLISSPPSPLITLESLSRIPRFSSQSSFGSS